MAIETVLVTGGAGFIGSALCRALAARGRHVVAFDNLSFGRRELLPGDSGCQLVEGDVRDAARLRELFRDLAPGTVCHLAALHFIPYCDAHPLETMDVNVNGTRAVLEACRNARPRLVLFASTAAVYPIAAGPLPEDRPAGPVDVYGYTKLMGEDLARLFALETGVPTLIARLFNAVGPHDNNLHVVPEILAQVARGGPLRLGNLDPVRDYIHVDDMVAAFLALLERPPRGCDVFNVGSGEGRSVRDVVNAFEAVVGPLTLTQDSQRVRRVDRAELVADVNKLCRETGWRPHVSFAEGIRRLLAGLPSAHS